MTETTQTIPIVMRLPATLGLAREQIDTLQKKWQADLTDAASAGSKRKIRSGIKIHIEIGSE
jgi:hypothetical protein